STWTEPGKLAKSIDQSKLSIPAAELPEAVALLLRGHRDIGQCVVPPLLCDVIRLILEGWTARLVCDPWAGVGVMAATVHDAVHAERAIGCSPNPSVGELGKVLAPHLTWNVGNPFHLLDSLDGPVDIVASVLPFGVRYKTPDSPGDAANSRSQDLAGL